MNKLGSRSDFISDGSSDEDSLPVISLRERLAKKRHVTPVFSINDDDDNVCIINSMVSNTATKSSTSEGCLDTVVRSVTTPKSLFDDVGSCMQVVDTLPCIGKSGPRISETASSNSLTLSNMTEASSNIKIRKKRTQEEILDNKRKAQEKKEEKEKIKRAKDAEKERKRVERESKKQISLGSCLKYIKVLVDTHIVNTCGLGAVLFKACEELGVACETLELPAPFTVMWTRQLTECRVSEDQLKVNTVNMDVEENDVIAVLPVTEFVQMVDSFKQKQRGLLQDGLTVRSYVEHLRSCLQGKTVTLIVPGLEQYFRDSKSKTQKKYREAVSVMNSAAKHGVSSSRPVSVSRIDVEESLVDVLLHTGTTVYMLESSDDVADHVRRFTKAIAERPAKKDRFDPVFSFHEEGAGGVKVDRNGGGLLKVWKQQLLQFKNVSPDVAQALVAEYPSPQLLRQAYKKCKTEKEAERLLENIVVRRGAGVLETSRRVGKELSRRIHTLFITDDPDLVIR